MHLLMTRSKIALLCFTSLSFLLLVACDSVLGGSPSSAVPDADLDRLTIVPTAPRATATVPAVPAPTAIATLVPVVVDGQCPPPASPAAPGKPNAFGAGLPAIAN